MIFISLDWFKSYCNVICWDANRWILSMVLPVLKIWPRMRLTVLHGRCNGISRGSYHVPFNYYKHLF